MIKIIYVDTSVFGGYFDEEFKNLQVSWNFKHIVNISKIKGYNGVNLMNDYPTLEIRNPREIFDYGD